MLQPAASSAQSSIALSLAGQAGTAETAEIPEGFAALLALGMSAPAGEEANPGALFEAASVAFRQNGTATGKVTGNLAGKILPVGSRDDAALAATDLDKTLAPATQSDQPGPQEYMTAEPMLAILGLALPMIPAALTALKIELPEAKPAPAPPQTPAPAQAAVAPPLAATIARLTAAQTKTPESPVAPAIATTPPRPPARADGTAAPKPASQPARQPGASIDITMIVEPTPGSAKTVAFDAVLATPVIAKPVAAKPDTAANVIATSSAAPVLANEAVAKPASRPVAATTSASVDTAPTRNPASAPDIAISDLAKPIAAAELQPLLALRDTQSFTPVSANAPVATATAPQPAGYDFATLVDRLVDARDAAMPQTIRAAVNHADFGQVSLSFQADDHRLAVSMTSADPDFAPAVQAAAAMQANTSTADNGSNASRQDAQNQQASNSATANQSQAQAQSQGSARSGERERADNGRQTGRDSESAPTKDDARPENRGGIYA